MAKIVFDFDGVLIKSRDSDKKFIWQKNIESDLGINQNIMSKIFEQPGWNEIVSGRNNFKNLLITLFDKYELKVHPDEFINYWLTHDLNWYQEVIELSEELKKIGHQIFVGTNQDKIRSDYLKQQKVISSLLKNVWPVATWEPVSQVQNIF